LVQNLGNNVEIWFLNEAITANYNNNLKSPDAVSNACKANKANTTPYKSNSYLFSHITTVLFKGLLLQK